ncbi:thymidylate kinase [Rhipicephalus microplus]|uniref:thymidylate kinase n=1 Tax=Rhipicephalus microplus TaxID=6941 RepID=UPI003F6C8F66
MSTRRGLFIVFEGCDRTGKTTQVKLLAEALAGLGHKTESIAFPKRSTATGKLLDAYLSKGANLDDHAVHLLFSANRWQEAELIRQAVAQQRTVICDRYAYSGVAFTAAKSLDFAWCQQPDRGLPEPDVVLYMSVPPDALNARDGFGNERYENAEFQAKVCANYDRLAALDSGSGRWVNVDATQSIEAVHLNVLKAVLDAMSRGVGDLGKLWWK